MSSVELRLRGENGDLPAGLTGEEESLFVDGLSQTCAALRRRVAELETENRRLQRTSRASAAGANAVGESATSAEKRPQTPGSMSPPFQGQHGAASSKQNECRSGDHNHGGSRQSGSILPSDEQCRLSSIGIDRSRHGREDEDGEKLSFHGYSPRNSGSVVNDKPSVRGSLTRRGGSVLPSSSLEDDDKMSLMSPSAAGLATGGRGVAHEKEREQAETTENSARQWVVPAGREVPPNVVVSSSTRGNSPGSLSPRAEEWYATRRVSAVPNRARYSVGVSRFSLPPNMSPNMSPSKSENDDGSPSTLAHGQQKGAGGVWEGLTLTHPLTRDEKELTFMEFAVISVGQSTLSGAHLLRDGGQETEVVSRFPNGGGDGGSVGEAGTTGGHEDVVFVEGLEDFCFPSGAGITLVEGGTALVDVFPEDRIHLVQFTDCDNTSTYGCCLTVTQVLQDPSPRLMKRLRDREETHAAARIVQRFMRRGCASRRRKGSDDNVSLSPKSAVTGVTNEGDSSPTSLSLMLNRFFASNQGVDSGDSGNVETTREATKLSSAAQALDSGAKTRLPQQRPLTTTSVTPSQYNRTETPPSNVSFRRKRSGLGWAGTRIGPKSYDTSDDQNSIRDGVYGGGNGDDAEMLLRNGPEGMSSTVLATVPGPIPGGTFSDDESESEAGYGTDCDAGEYEASMVTERDRNVVVGRDGVTWRHGSPPRVAQKTSPGENEGETLRFSSVPAQVKANTTPVTPPKLRTTSAAIGASRNAAGSPYVLVERCYAMVSCHRNHSLMFKVLKAIADAERTTRPGSTTPSSTPPHPRKGSSGAFTLEGSGSVPPPLPARDGDGVKENPRTASRFRSVAAAAAQEAKGRHRRMVRDKFLQQVRTDKGGIEEGKKVSIHCPAFIRTPLELTAVPMELWATAVLFASLPEGSIVRSLNVLLLETTLVVCGRDLDMVSMTATALLSLLEPLKWEGVFVPVVPAKLMDVLDSPVPALVGVQGPLDAIHRNAFQGVIVLDLDATTTTHQVSTGGIEERLPVLESLVKSLENSNTLRGRGRGSTSPATRSPARDNTSVRDASSPNREGATSNKRYGGVNTGGSRRMGTSPGPRSPFAFQASTFMSGMTPEEKGTVLRLRSLVRNHVTSFCGDLPTPGTWRKYGKYSDNSGDFEFYPHWFTDPLETLLKFQVSVAHTQMFDSFVDRCRMQDVKALAEEAEAHSQRLSATTTPVHSPQNQKRNSSTPRHDEHDDSATAARLSGSKNKRLPQSKTPEPRSSSSGHARKTPLSVSSRVSSTTPPPLPTR